MELRRNKHYKIAVDSFERAGVPMEIVRMLRAGINGNLEAILQSKNAKVIRKQSHGPDLRISNLGTPLDRGLLESKLLFDGTGIDYYQKVVADRDKLTRWKTSDLECVQVVFFTQLPSFRYPAGRWYKATKSGARKTPFLGIDAQFRQLMSAMPQRPTWPEMGAHVHSLKFPTGAITEELLLRRYAQIFAPTYPWRFNAAEQLQNAQVGVALWRI